MKILHSGTFDVNNGGPAMSTYNTLWGLRNLGIDAQIFMYPLSPTGKLKGEDIPIHYTQSPIEQKFQYSPKYQKDMIELGEYDIYHAQGIWQYPTYALATVARKINKPYLITPRGMLYPQDISKSNRLLKIISLKLRLLKDLNNAVCVHVTCEDEMKHCRSLGVRAPIAIIPNPVEIKDYKETKQDNIFRLGYLGRLSPRKNIESLIYAFAKLKTETNNAELIIIGGGDIQYEKFLRNEAERLNLTNIHFTGFLSGKEKDLAIASCSVLAMPSEFENFGNVILEGLVRKIPCIATYGSPWKELNTHNCGWWVEYSQDSITKAIQSALHTSTNELKQMGINGRKLMEQSYSIEAVATQMMDLYKWIIYHNNKPEFVYD